MRDVLERARQLPAHHVPAKAARWTVRQAQRKARGWWMRRQGGEMTDAAFLAAYRGEFSSADDVLRHMATRTKPVFFVSGPEEGRRRASVLAEAHPALAERTLAAANAVRAHMLDLLGSGPRWQGDVIDWHADIRSGYRWPVAFHQDIDYHVTSEQCDIKMPWEMNRCHQWVTLARAYAQTGDRSYTDEIAAQMESWLDLNPWLYGVNWGRALEVAERAVNWIWTWTLARDALASPLQGRLLKALVQHGRYILDNLEYSDNNGNHYLSNGVGLLFLGLFFRELPEAERWLAKAREIVWGEIGRQVHPDGVDFEKGIGYQGFVTEFWYTSLILCRLNDVAVPDAATERLQRMFDLMLAYTRPDGTFPQIGDNDDARLAGLDDEPPGSHRRHLAVGGMLFHRPELLGAASDVVETAVWLLGEDVLTAPRQVLEAKSRAFPQGGFYVMADRDAVLVADAGEAGMNGIGGHGHNDMLSFDLWAAGAPLLVDSGTYTYTGDPAAREALRGVAGHNAVRVDGQEMARLGGERWLWRIENDAHPTVHAWLSDARHDLLDAEHDGYARLGQPVWHRRRILFDKERRVWIVQDLLRGDGRHAIDVFLHPASAACVVDRAGLAARLRAPRGDLLVSPLGATSDLRVEWQSGWVSRAYGHREEAPVLVYSAHRAMPTSVVVGLALASADETSETIRQRMDAAYATLAGTAGATA